MVSDIFFLFCSILFTESASRGLFYWPVGSKKEKGIGRVAGYCLSDYVLLQGRRACGTQVLAKPRPGGFFECAQKNLMVSGGPGMEMSDTRVFFSESTHSLVGEADIGITKHNYVANQNEIC